MPRIRIPSQVAPWQDRDVLRICVSNWSTGADDVAVAVAAVRQALALAAGRGRSWPGSLARAARGHS